MYVGNGLPIGSRAHPLDGAARLEVGFQLRPREDDAIGFRGHKPLPDFLRRGGKVEDVFQRFTIGHGVEFYTAEIRSRAGWPTLAIFEGWEHEQKGRRPGD